MSGCCTNAHLCAPSCVCTTSTAELFVACDSSSPGATGLAPLSGEARNGCELGLPASSASALSLLLASCLLLLLRRTRGRRSSAKLL
jgi:hypothetical protein